jgi:7-cyano-7-deazaguanine reductase
MTDLAASGDLPSMSLETFPNPNPERDYEIEIEQPEFTSICPKTGNPDFGTILIAYVPDETCVELKSLKLWLQSYRNQGIYYEALTNEILDTLVEALEPRRMMVVGEFTSRGGISTTVTAEYDAVLDGEDEYEDEEEWDEDEEDDDDSAS